MLLIIYSYLNDNRKKIEVFEINQKMQSIQSVHINCTIELLSFFFNIFNIFLTF